MVSRAELRSSGRMGFSDEDLKKAIGRGLAWREDVQAHDVALRKMMETGATGRTRIKETGLGERKGMEIEAARPLRKAKAGYYGAGGRKFGAEAATEEYGLGFKKEYADTIGGILKQAKEKGRLDIQSLEQGLGKKIEEEEDPMGAHVDAVMKRAVKEQRGRESSWDYARPAKSKKRAWHPWLRKYAGAPFRAAGIVDDLMRDLLGEAHKYWRPEVK